MDDTHCRKVAAHDVVETSQRHPMTLAAPAQGSEPYQPTRHDHRPFETLDKAQNTRQHTTDNYDLRMRFHGSDIQCIKFAYLEPYW